MKIDLRSHKNKSNIKDVRSQIQDKAFLQKFDKFVESNGVFDFKNDEHLRALKKIDFESNCSINAEL